MTCLFSWVKPQRRFRWLNGNRIGWRRWAIEYALWDALIEALIMINCRGSPLILEIDRQAWSGG
jgi:hypothetical protein